MEVTANVDVAAIPTKFDRFSTKANNGDNPCSKILSVNLPATFPPKPESSLPTPRHAVQPRLNAMSFELAASLPVETAGDSLPALQSVVKAALKNALQLLKVIKMGTCRRRINTRSFFHHRNPWIVPFSSLAVFRRHHSLSFLINWEWKGNANH